MGVNLSLDFVLEGLLDSNPVLYEPLTAQCGLHLKYSFGLGEYIHVCSTDEHQSPQARFLSAETDNALVTS